jgi:ribonucleotide monophosphatase NagD (HAD superfamily)
LELSNNKAINSQGTVKLKIEKVVCPHLTTTHLDETERRNNVQQTIKKLQNGIIRFCIVSQKLMVANAIKFLSATDRNYLL